MWSDMLIFPLWFLDFFGVFLENLSFLTFLGPQLCSPSIPQRQLAMNVLIEPCRSLMPALWVPYLLTRCNNVWGWEVLHCFQRTWRKQRVKEPRQSEQVVKVGREREELKGCGAKMRKNPVTLTPAPKTHAS